jgi:DNA replication protein DnaC
MNGACIDTGIDKTALNRCSRPVGNFIGRYKEMYQIINKLMMPVSGKIYTVWGQHGVGKTALVQAVMHYVNERNLIKGGFSFISANGVTNCEVFLRKLNF